jgi:hypothetical protein
MNPPVSLFTRCLIATLALVSPARSAMIALDFGATGQDVQAGYTAVSGTGGLTFLPSPVFTVPSAALPPSVTMTLTASAPSNPMMSFRDRGSFSTANYGTEADLFEDYIRAGHGAAVTNNEFHTMIIDVGGLAPATEYSINLRLYDGAINAARAGGGCDG